MRQPAPLANGLAASIRHDFRTRAEACGYTLSAGQLQVIEHMARQAAQLDTGQARSLYLHGAVGRGKSWLLDGFFQALPQARKRRLHFHNFFARLHQGMFDHRHQDDALAHTLDALLEDCQVLCFDEFHVHDIGDAMLITRLFQALFERQVLLLLTSNYPPEGLLPNPLYHQRFAPVIGLINSRMLVLEVTGEQDFRSLPSAASQQRFSQGHYLWPGNREQRLALHLPEPSATPITLEVGKRQLRAWLHAQRTVGFDFVELCEQPTAVIDYLELARRFDYWIIEHLPTLEDCSIAAQQRFINLIDVLYDQDKHLVLIGSRPLADSLNGSASDLARTRSRLGQLRQVISADAGATHHWERES
ncbi:cell division protein ZapE [Pseudomonas sp. TNT2022 ID1025]|uniref:Cell division protein ZapE n=1 Tax=Pseudomonas rubra TaxID=2942627 RepID=A0ABT5P3J7_9PSED|nr:cell division protein ZapE [Pseudomonas rubra]MDD1012722.1 cell division protein ZapE [Pseudomonas rubra]MDD1036694.1 cell division protein ZapE [Pseudomonas rubra]MDD1156056.1 cell division protein ZapE [Pseudomonas rubra]